MSDLTITAPGARVPEGTITLNGESFVPMHAYEVAQDKGHNGTRTLAMAHMHLVFGDADAALAVIQRGTGFGIEDARAVASLVQWARSRPEAASV